MRCTKCHYLSFEPEPRCKNCGHDLSIDELVQANQDPLGDIQLDLSGSPGGVAVLERPAVSAPVSLAAPAPAAPMTAELPLFVRDLIPDDEDDLEPLIKVPQRPRPPLAVRRPTPDPVRMRARYAPPSPEPDLLSGVEEPTSAPIQYYAPAASEPEPPAPSVAAAPAVPAVPTGQRVAAAAIDAGFLGAIAAVVVVFTMQLAELPLAQITVLPVIPMLGFFALISVGYELMFTAYSGQTIGKMIMRLRVISTGDDHGHTVRVSLRQAAIRAMSMLPLGAGLLTALVGPGLAIHDRMAHTRVVRA